MSPAVTVVVPTYREEGNLAPLLAGLADALKGRDYELLVVDDDSPDGTAAEARAAAAADPRVRLIQRRGVPRDLAASVAQGFAAGRGAVLATLNADGSHDPAVLPRLLDSIKDGVELAVGSRYAPGGVIADWPLSRRLLSLAGTAAARGVLGLSVRDPLSGYYALTRGAYERAALGEARGFKVLMRVLARAKPRAVELPIAFKDRRRGASKMSLKTAFWALRDLLRLAGGAD